MRHGLVVNYVVLLRGINVGGRNRLAMADLRRLIDKIGGGDSMTYIQSGNAVCTRLVDAERLADEIESANGFRPTVVVLDGTTFTAIASESPFDLGAGKAVHIYFADRPITFDLDAARALAAPTELVDVGSRAVYLSAPDGVARSKLATKIESFADASLTARNGATIQALLEILSNTDE